VAFAGCCIMAPTRRRSGWKCSSIPTAKGLETKKAVSLTRDGSVGRFSSEMIAPAMAVGDGSEPFQGGTVKGYRDKGQSASK